MATRLTTHLGKVSLLAKNSRIIRDNAFNRLVESIERDPEFLMARGIVVWQVPKPLEMPVGGKSVFEGQEGELVVIGGNQRCKAFMALGKSEIKPEWLVEAKDETGNWWSPEKAERFVLLDNNPGGIAGSNDRKKLAEHFSELSMRLAGIDFSGFREAVRVDMNKKVEEEVEKGEHGEKSLELDEFIERRERSRRDLKEINAAGFYLVVVFENMEDKIRFVSRAGLVDEEGKSSVDGAEYLVLVFETYDQKMDFCRKAGLSEEPGDEEYENRIVYGRFVDGRAFAKKFGIELKESGLHFRERRIDAQLADMAMEDAKQKTEGEIQEQMRAEAESESEQMELEDSSEAGGEGGEEDGFGDDLPPGDVEGDEDEGEEAPAS